MLNNLFINYYKMFVNTHKTPIVSAASVLSLVFVGYFLLIALFIKIHYLFDITRVNGSKGCFIIGYLLLVFFFIFYYKKKNLAAMVSIFDAKGKNQKTIWNVLSVVILVLPYVLIIGTLVP